MIKDRQNAFSIAQTVTTGSENGVLSTDKIDLGSDRNIGAGQNLYIVAQVATTMAGTNPNATTVALVTDDNAGLNSPTVIQTLGVFPTNSVAGTRIIARIQPNPNFERYIGLRYTATNALSASAFTAFIANDVDAGEVTESGYEILG